MPVWVLSERRDTAAPSLAILLICSKLTGTSSAHTAMPGRTGTLMSYMAEGLAEVCGCCNMLFLGSLLNSYNCGTTGRHIEACP